MMWWLILNRGGRLHRRVVTPRTRQTIELGAQRECFLPGVMMAVKKVQGLNRLYYGLDQIL